MPREDHREHTPVEGLIIWWIQHTINWRVGGGVVSYDMRGGFNYEGEDEGETWNKMGGY
jgi:hypothetical protein